MAQSTASKVRWVHASVYDDLAWTISERFDVAVSTEVVEHLYRPKELFVRASELLHPGGRLILTTPYHGYLKNLAIALSNKWDAHHDVTWEGGHIKFFSNQALKRMAESVGFERVEFSGLGRLPYLWKSTLMVARRPA